MENQSILQLTGEPGAGKSEVASYLAGNHGFSLVQVSNLLREYAEPRNIPLRSRADYGIAHTRMLAELGSHAVPDKILASSSPLVCVDGMRVPAHAAKLREYGAKIVSFECPAEVRYQRARRRGGKLDNVEYEEFLRAEESEDYSPNPFKQATRAVMEMADYHIDSSRSFRAVTLSVERLLPLLLRTG